MVRSMMNLTTLPLSFWDYALESATRILNMVPTKKVDKTPYELWYGKVPNLSYLKSRNAERRAVDLEEIQEEEDTTPSENTSNIPQEVKGFEPPQPPQEEVIPIRRSKRTHRAPNRLCLNVEVEEHSLGDLNEPTSYKAAMLDSESNKWIDAMNKKTDMDGIVHTYKARHVAKGYTQLYRVDYEETFSPVAVIRAIMILISIAAFYDYEMWQMDVKTAFLNGKYASLRDPFMVLSKHQEAGIKDLMRKSKDMFLVYGGNPEAELRVTCYCDAGFETDRDDIKSLMGYVFILNGGTIDWKSSKQSTTAMSTTEAERKLFGLGRYFRAWYCTNNKRTN
ncbi:zinc finger, CCHC-type containing protein [Tanacetum coccineum]|uniref:Zinc finger, CCHC-type containing protein n=1 Tax=Tanacetum coccineum TaxID=301880 RepID=A0ABQ5BQR4_9ASTR